MNQLGHVIFNVLSGVVVFWLAWPRVRRLGFTIYDEIDNAFYMIFGMLVGGWAANALPRIVDALAGGSQYDPWWAAGQHWMGLVVGGSLVGALWTRRRGFPLGTSFDAFAPLLPIGLAVIRIGCYLNADSSGRPTDSWIGQWLPDVYGVYAMRYPTQMVSLAANLLLAGALFGFEFYARRQGRLQGWPFAGFLFWLYVGLYCVGRIYFEFWRGDMYPWIGPFTYTHLYCFVGILLAGGAMLRGLRAQPG